LTGWQKLALPNYNESGNVKPVIFNLSNLVSFFPRTNPDDAEFRLPINKIENVKTFDNEFGIYPL
jgi:hypothetical protein